MKKKISALWALVWIMFAAMLIMFVQMLNMKETNKLKLEHAEAFRTSQVNHWNDLYAKEHHTVTQLQAINEQLRWDLDREGK